MRNRVPMQWIGSVHEGRAVAPQRLPLAVAHRSSTSCPSRTPAPPFSDFGHGESRTFKSLPSPAGRSISKAASSSSSSGLARFFVVQPPMTLSATRAPLSGFLRSSSRCRGRYYGGDPRTSLAFEVAGGSGN
ncbi:uncharacterized protein A4U43_C07F8640 [Asparagus officinalis]|uniref:Uncharacterized protein n=1 Tax=Asparagus officinalis TaxID=4686 RepID=A0A5P1ECA7_ASPOF|nr:uncharacterized protein A4U43_C07F8640 [Asparagus officinalis]